MATLDASRQLISDLWVDQPDAHEQIERRRAEGRLAPDDAEILKSFVDQGYAKVSLTDLEGIDRAFDDEVDRLWRERPTDLAMAPPQGGRMSFHDATEEDRRIGYRIADMHSHSPVARGLYLHSEIFRVVELIFDQPAVSFQSLYFQFGSEQSLHRDPMFVVAEPASHLLASWIALEDITPDSGPLLYVPGSHRMPWFEFHPDTITASNEDKQKRQNWSKYRERMLEEMGLEALPFTCQQGDVFIWHAGLLHGGQKVTNPQSTRKSFVTHYSTAANYTSRRATMKVISEADKEEQWVGASGTTTDLLELDGHRGIDNPLRRMVVATPKSKKRRSASR